MPRCRDRSTALGCIRGKLSGPAQQSDCALRACPTARNRWCRRHSMNIWESCDEAENRLSGSPRLRLRAFVRRSASPECDANAGPFSSDGLAWIESHRQGHPRGILLFCKHETTRGRRRAASAWACSNAEVGVDYFYTGVHPRNVGLINSADRCFSPRESGVSQGLRTLLESDCAFEKNRRLK